MNFKVDIKKKNAVVYDLKVLCQKGLMPKF